MIGRPEASVTRTSRRTSSTPALNVEAGSCAAIACAMAAAAIHVISPMMVCATSAPRKPWAILLLRALEDGRDLPDVVGVKRGRRAPDKLFQERTGLIHVSVARERRREVVQRVVVGQ